VLCFLSKIQQIRAKTTIQKSIHMIQTIFSLIQKGDGQANTGEAIHIRTEHGLSEEAIAIIRAQVSDAHASDLTRSDRPFLDDHDVVEIGPRNACETPWGTNARDTCKACGINGIMRIERTFRYRIGAGDADDRESIIARHLDRMTQVVYGEQGEKPTFENDTLPEPVREIDLIGAGADALRAENKRLGLGLDEKDIEFYMNLFVRKLHRNPTDVELMQLSNANSDHCRHTGWNARLVIDGETMPHTLMQLARMPLVAARQNGNNNVLAAFNDNSGVVRGFRTFMLMPTLPGHPSPYETVEVEVHTTGTAETHNHPVRIEPYEGAKTGVGGRERDTQATGTGAMLGMGSAMYCTGNLHIPEYHIPGEEESPVGRHEYATPLQVMVRASNGAMHYGNEMGEPNLVGCTYAFGQVIDGQYYGWHKPILYSASAGIILDRHVKKHEPRKGDLIVAFGGPAYRIGIGGGNASSLSSGQNDSGLDFKSVQRGDGMMAQKTRRVIEACVAMGERNPILSIHDQGAGGPANVLTELAKDQGMKIDIRRITVGDTSLSVLEIWVAEFQERFGLLVDPTRIDEFKAICIREEVNCEVLGEVTGDGRIVVIDSNDGTIPVDLPIADAFADLPQKTFDVKRKVRNLKPVELPESMTVAEAFEIVLRRPEVGSKGMFTRHGDRSVGGRVWYQQHCGQADIPIGNFGAITNGFEGFEGTVEVVGTAPYVMLINPAAGASMGIVETVLHLAMSPLPSLERASVRVNWMVDMKGSVPELYDAAKAVARYLSDIGLPCCGGKDSSSMKTPDAVSPMTCVINAYGSTPDVRKCLTPDLKRPGRSDLYLVDIGSGEDRLGGSSLAIALSQIGCAEEAPDMPDAKLLQSAFLAIKEMIRDGSVLSMHDRSDGGLMTAVAEMCMASNAGFRIDVPERINESRRQLLAWLFNQEGGLIVELSTNDGSCLLTFTETCKHYGLRHERIGSTVACMSAETLPVDGRVYVGEECEFSMDMRRIRQLWEMTGNMIERHRIDPECAEEEFAQYGELWPNIYNLKGYGYRLTFDPHWTPPNILTSKSKPKAAVIRAPGSNGDKELVAMMRAAGFEVWDVTMNDLQTRRMPDLSRFNMIGYPGGFSHMDVFGAGVGWAATVSNDPHLKQIFGDYHGRPDTLSIGICNGCQFMAARGLFPDANSPAAPHKQPRFVRNRSGFFESRRVLVEVLESPSVFFEGMVGCKLPIMGAHGEGRLVFPDDEMRMGFERDKLLPLRFIDPAGEPTEKYPWNPNGSVGGYTAITSRCGHHLAFMLHPERGLYMKQKWTPAEWSGFEVGPWLRMFQNARAWCATAMNARDTWAAC
jgi:phosphoribosylformylglycinamidine synthase